MNDFSFLVFNRKIENLVSSVPSNDIPRGQSVNWSFSLCLALLLFNLHVFLVFTAREQEESMHKFIIMSCCTMQKDNSGVCWRWDVEGGVEAYQKTISKLVWQRNPIFIVKGPGEVFLLLPNRLTLRIYLQNILNIDLLRLDYACIIRILFFPLFNFSSEQIQISVPKQVNAALHSPVLPFPLPLLLVTRNI